MSEESRRAEFLRRKDTYEDLMEEVRPYVGMSPEETDRTIQIVCRSAAQQLSENADRKRILQWDDPMPESSRRHWERLLNRYHRGRPSP